MRTLPAKLVTNTVTFKDESEAIFYIGKSLLSWRDRVALAGSDFKLFYLITPSDWVFNPGVIGEVLIKGRLHKALFTEERQYPTNDFANRSFAVKLTTEIYSYIP